VAVVNEIPKRVIPVLREHEVVPAEVNLAESMFSVQGDQLIIVDAEGTQLETPISDELKADLSAQLGNIDRIGLSLFEGHPLGIELAGIILLLSMVGAIVIGRKNLILDAAAPGRSGTAPTP